MLSLAAELVLALDTDHESGFLSHHSILVFLPTYKALEEMYQMLRDSGLDKSCGAFKRGLHTYADFPIRPPLEPPPITPPQGMSAIWTSMSCTRHWTLRTASGA